jgi:hypothetical protein
MSHDRTADLHAVGQELFQSFEKREMERKALRASLEHALGSIASIESGCKDLAAFGPEERYRVAKARVELLRAMRTIERGASTPGESTMRNASSWARRE